MIEVLKISKTFGKLRALDQVTLTCREGQCIALIGPNGCGKTTLIKTILGMVIPSSGEIKFDNVSIAKDFRYRNHIGYMPQIGRYPDNMKIGQVIEMVTEIRKSESRDEDLLNEFKLRDQFNKRMSTLSGGTTQKVSAILAFLFNPKVLILDEPTAGLDPLASEILKEKILSERKKGKLILVTSHLLAELDELISEIVFMQEGQLKFHRTVEELKVSTGETKISKAIANVLRGGTNG